MKSVFKLDMSVHMPVDAAGAKIVSFFSKSCEWRKRNKKKL